MKPGRHGRAGIDVLRLRRSLQATEVFSYPDAGLGMGRFIQVENPEDQSRGGLSAREPKVFEFDRVFGPGECHVPFRRKPRAARAMPCCAAGSTQQEVFEDVQPLVQASLDGFNCTVFGKDWPKLCSASRFQEARSDPTLPLKFSSAAYGQTGSGKTFTMEGYPGQPGIMYRAFDEIFKLTRHGTLDPPLSLSLDWPLGIALITYSRQQGRSWQGAPVPGPSVRVQGHDV